MKGKNIFEVQFHHEQGYNQTGFEFSPCNKSTPISEVAIGCTLARWDCRGIHCSHFIAAGDFPQTTFFILQKSIPAECFGHFERLHLLSGLTINFLEEATHPLPWLDRYLPNLSRHLSLRPIWLALDPHWLECNEPIFWMHFSEQSTAVSSYLEAAPASGWGKHWYFNKYQTLVEENIDISPQIPLNKYQVSMGWHFRSWIIGSWWLRLIFDIVSSWKEIE